MLNAGQTCKEPTNLGLDRHSSEPPSKLNGFAVLDAFGLRIGSVRETRFNAAGEIELITVSIVATATRSGIYRLPVSDITHVSPNGKFLQLARISREAFGDFQESTRMHAPGKTTS